MYCFLPGTCVCEETWPHLCPLLPCASVHAASLHTCAHLPADPLTLLSGRLQPLLQADGHVHQCCVCPQGGAAWRGWGRVPSHTGKGACPRRSLGPAARSMSQRRPCPFVPALGGHEIVYEAGEHPTARAPCRQVHVAIVPAGGA